MLGPDIVPVRPRHRLVVQDVRGRRRDVLQRVADRRGDDVLGAVDVVHELAQERAVLEGHLGVGEHVLEHLGQLDGAGVVRVLRVGRDARHGGQLHRHEVALRGHDLAARWDVVARGQDDRVRRRTRDALGTRPQHVLDGRAQDDLAGGGVQDQVRQVQRVLLGRGRVGRGRLAALQGHEPRGGGLELGREAAHPEHGLVGDLAPHVQQAEDAVRHGRQVCVVQRRGEQRERRGGTGLGQRRVDLGRAVVRPLAGVGWVLRPAEGPAQVLRNLEWIVSGHLTAAVPASRR